MTAKRPGKPGPEPEPLKIEGDPAAALHQLLGKLERPDRQGRRLQRRDRHRRSQLSWVFEIFHQEGIERSDIVIARARLTIDAVILVLHGHPDQTATVSREDSRSGREDAIRATAREWKRLLG